MKNTFLIAAILAVFFALVFFSVNSKSPICDEAGHHIAAGFSYIKTGDFRMNPSAPPLIRLIMGFPLVFLDLKLPLDHPSWSSIDSTEFSRQFLYVCNKNAGEIVSFARFPMIILSVMLGFFIFIWAKELYGQGAGLFALFLYVFSPSILANAGLAMLDMGCALLLFLSMFQLWRFIKNRTPLNLILTGACFGFAQASKYTSLALFPVFLIIMLADTARQREDRKIAVKKTISDMAAIWLIGFFVLWGTYFFEFKPLLQNAPDIDEKAEYIKRAVKNIPFAGHERLFQSVLYFAKIVPIPLSTYFVSFGGVAKSVAAGDQKLFFMGKEVLSGDKIYYIVLYLIRTPLPSLFLLLLALLRYRRRSNKGVMANLFLILPIIVIFATASFSKLQGGLRYLLPVYPFLFVWMSGLVNRVDFKTGFTAFKALFFALCVWYFGISVFTYPHYLAYFNETVGGSDGFAYKITADADWGQDLKELKKYLDRKGIENIRLYYFGTADPAYYRIRYNTLKEEEFIFPVPGAYYAISSRYLKDVQWASELKPAARVGHTIFIYNIPKNP